MNRLLSLVVACVCLCCVSASVCSAATVFPAIGLFNRNTQVTNRSGCPNGSCRPSAPQQTQPQNVDPPQFDMPGEVQPESEVAPVSDVTPATVGGGVAIVVVSGSVGAYRAYKKPKAR